MKKSIFSIKTLLLFSFLLCICFLAHGQDKTTKHMLWEVSSPSGVKGYLAGAIHMVKPDFYPLDSIFRRCFDKSDTAVFELDNERAKTGLMSAMNLAVYKNGDHLKDHLPKKLYSKTEARLKKIGLKAESFKPWFAAFVIKGQNILKQGDSIPGIDSHFNREAEKEGKPIVALETAKEQMKIFSSLGEKEQVKFLKYVLNNTENKQSPQNEKLVSYWKSGNVKAMHQLLNNKSFAHLGNISKQLNQRLIIDRNENWREQLEKMFEKEKVFFVVVGLGHLVGNHNLIDMLKKDGYTVQQM